MNVQTKLEAIDVKQIEAMRILFYRLQKELELLETSVKAHAYLESNLVLDKLGALDTPVEPDSLRQLREKKGKVQQALRWSVYECTNQLKQWSDEAIRLKDEAKTQAAEALEKEV